MSLHLFQASKTGVASTDGTVTVKVGQSCWHNMVSIVRGTATAGTLTLKYQVFGKTYNVKDSTGSNITFDLSSDPDPIVFDGLAYAIVIDQSGVNGTFDIQYAGSQ